MKKTYAQLVFVLAGMIYVSSAVSNSYHIIPDSMVVITNNQRPLQHSQYAQQRLTELGKNFTVYNLDAVDALEDKISEGLPMGETLALEALKNKISVIGKDTFDQQFLSAYTGLMFAFKHQVDRYPVIIFNNESAIYGVTDVKQAMQQYHNWEYVRLGVEHE